MAAEPKIEVSYLYRVSGLHWREGEFVLPIDRITLTHTDGKITAVGIDNDDDKLKTCSWVYRDDDDCWEMSCGGDEWCFNDGGVVENRVKYCVNCGRPVLIASGEQEGKP